MLDFIAKGLAKVFGTKSDREIKDLLPKVTEINQIYSELKNLNDDQLREKTQEIRQLINERLKKIDDQITALRGQIDGLPAQAIHEKDRFFNQIDQLEKDRDVELENVLEEVLPQVFAVVKETARRFKENGQLTVKANLRDKELDGCRKRSRLGHGPL